MLNDSKLDTTELPADHTAQLNWSGSAQLEQLSALGAVQRGWTGHTQLDWIRAAGDSWMDMMRSADWHLVAQLNLLSGFWI
jgi:hypothetical protein